MVSVLNELLQEDLEGTEQTDAIIKTVPLGLLLRHYIFSTRTIDRAIHKALDLSGVLTSYVDLDLPRNSPIAHKCIVARCCADVGGDILTEWMRAQPAINMLL